MGSSQVRRKTYILCSTLVTGGAEMVVSYLARGLPKSGHPVEVICLRTPGAVGERLAGQGVPLTSGIASSRFDLTAIGKLAGILRERPDPVLISLDHHDAMFIGAIASKTAGVRRRILSVHSTGLWGKGGTFSFSDRIVLPMFGRIVALSPSHADFLLHDGRLARDRVSIIPNGIDTVRFRPYSTGERSIRRERSGVPADSFVVTIVAALRPEKNHSMFIDAAADLATRDERYHFLVVGDGAEAEKLHKRAERLIAGGRIQFLGTRDDVEEILGSSDAAVLCSHPVVETFPMTVLEAMSAGLPVVSTDVGSVSEMLKNGEEGILIPSGNSAVLAASIDMLAGDPAKAARIGKAARERVIRDYSESVMVGGYARLIESLG